MGSSPSVSIIFCFLYGLICDVSLDALVAVFELTRPFVPAPFIHPVDFIKPSAPYFLDGVLVGTVAGFGLGLCLGGPTLRAVGAWPLNSAEPLAYETRASGYTDHVDDICTGALGLCRGFGGFEGLGPLVWTGAAVVPMILLGSAIGVVGGYGCGVGGLYGAHSVLGYCGLKERPFGCPPEAVVVPDASWLFTLCDHPLFAKPALIDHQGPNPTFLTR